MKVSQLHLLFHKRKSTAKKRKLAVEFHKYRPKDQIAVLRLMLASLVMSVIMAVRSVSTMVIADVLLSVFFVSGALAACPEDADLFITAPQEMEALNGSCLQIPCNFSAEPNKDFNSSRTTFGLWIIKNIDFANNPQNVVFNSSNRNNLYPMNITGDLSEKNCTTLFSSLLTKYTEAYFFRIENIQYFATASCNHLQINVKDSPPRPRIEIPGDLKEKESVTITCTASTPCPHSPPKLTWSLQQDPLHIREENTDRTLTTKIQKTLILSDKDDGFNITCSAGYPVNEGKDVKTAEERTTLSVSYAPKNTSVFISPPGLVSAGSLVNLTCSSRANPPVSNFTWFKNSKDETISVAEGNFYSFNVTEGVYFCVARNALGEQKSLEIHLPNKGKDSSRLGPVLGGIFGIIVLICLAVCVWHFKSKHRTAQPSQSQTGEEQSAIEEASKTEEDIHYGEIGFSERRPEPSSASEQEGGQEPDTVYAQVRVSQTTNSLTQPTADVPEDIYAQVKKK